MANITTFNHSIKPAPFNPEARPGLQKAVSDKHAQWCEEHPGVSNAARKAAYAVTYMSLRSKFPSVGELSK